MATVAEFSPFTLSFFCLWLAGQLRGTCLPRHAVHVQLYVYLWVALSREECWPLSSMYAAVQMGGVPGSRYICCRIGWHVIRGLGIHVCGKDVTEWLAVRTCGDCSGVEDVF